MHNSVMSIWLFIGLILSIYGASMMGSGINEWATASYPARVRPAQLHAPVWRGATLLALGICYDEKFLPRGAGKQ